MYAQVEKSTSVFHIQEMYNNNSKANKSIVDEGDCTNREDVCVSCETNGRVA
jgi:hypothetical protein